jgi:redox-sensitive bicupin YhaK (pirin superfamily)
MCLAEGIQRPKTQNQSPKVTPFQGQLMINIRKANERGHFNHGWLNTYHSFSFDQYYDPRFMGFRNLRVINEDFVSPGHGFPTHSHRDMEIITYTLA